MGVIRFNDKIQNNPKEGLNVFGYLAVFVLLLIVSTPLAFATPTVDLGTAGDYIILSKAGISATGTTFVNGDIGVSPIDSTAITGFGALPLDPTGQFSTSVLVSGKIYAADYASPTPSKLEVAIGNMETAYTDALSRPTDFLNSGNGAGEIGGLTLAPGVYTFTGDSINVLISTDLLLNGTSDDVWIFQIPGTFNLANGKKVNLSGGAIAKNIFWVVTGATVLGTDSVLPGTIIDATSIAIQTGATLNGNALAQTAVTLQSNSINDTDLPVISRTGFADLNVDFNSIYIDEGATAFDNVDGDLTTSIITFNDVNTLKVGTYIVTYDVDDLSGNSAIQVTRNVNVLDSNRPLITLNGSDVNVVIDSNYIDAGATAYDVVDGNLTSLIVTVNSVDTSILGLYTVTYDVNDLSGNSAIQVIRNVNVVDSNTGVVDTNLPVITLIGSSSITVIIDSNYVDAGATAVDDVDGNLTSSIIVFNDVNTLKLGTYVVTYVVTYDVNDSSGNSAIQVIRDVNVIAAAVIDSPPVITLIGSSSITVIIGSTYVDAGATAEDDVDGNLTSSIVTVNPVNTLVLGTYIITYDVNDSNGQNAVQIKRTVVVSSEFSLVTSPTTSNPKGWFKEPVGVSFSHDANTEIRFCRSDSLNGTSCLKLNPDWNSTNHLPKYIPKLAQDYNVYSTELTFSNDGNNYIKYFAIAQDQNVNDFDAANALVHYIPIDRTAPVQQMFFVVGYEPNSFRGISMNIVPPWTIKTTTGLILAKLSLTGSGVDATSGIDYCQVNFDYNADPNNWGAKLTLEQAKYLSYRYTTTGMKVIAAFCKDNADNNTMWLSTSSPFKISVIDTNYPTTIVSLTANPNPINLDNNYTLTYAVPDGNALSSVTFDINGVDYSISVIAVKNSDGTFSAVIIPDANMSAGVINVTARTLDTSNYSESFSENFDSTKTVIVIPPTPTGTGGGGTGGGTGIITPVVEEEVPTEETGPTNPDTIDTNPDEEETNLDVETVPGTDGTNPATGAFGLGNESTTGMSPTGFFGLGQNGSWIWFLLLIPAMMWVHSSNRIKDQRLEDEKLVRDEKLADAKRERANDRK